MFILLLWLRPITPHSQKQHAEITGFFAGMNPFGGPLRKIRAD
jgi:hypothetical protein